MEALDSNSNQKKKIKRRLKMSVEVWINLGIFAFSEILGGVTFSLLSPFYTQEATSKGMSVSETGLVYSIAFLTTIIFSPIFGKYISIIGSRELFILGTLLAGLMNVLFGLLQWVMNRTPFLVLSIVIRFLTSMGEAAFFTSIYPLAAQAVDSSRRATILSVMETMFGIGLTIGPFIGGLLYEYGGFYLPFVVSGSILVFCTICSSYLLRTRPTTTTTCTSSSTHDGVTFKRLLKMPPVFLSCMILCISSLSVSWHLPSLQPFLLEKYQAGTVTIGGMLMLDGATYALFSPIWGYFLDRGLKHIQALLIGSVLILIGYSLLGPLPFLDFLPHNIYVVGSALFIHGVGTAANFITTLTLMMSRSREGGAPDSEQTSSMVTSLWFINDCLGGYLGSLLGGISYENIGFEWSTLVLDIFMLITLLVIIPVLYFYLKPSNDQRTPLLIRNDSMTSYDSI